MTQEEKELLLKDLCARLPYGVKVQQSPKYIKGDVGYDTAYESEKEPKDFNIIGIEGTNYLITDKKLVENTYLKGKVSTPVTICIYNGWTKQTAKPYLRSMSSMTEEEVKKYKCMNDALDENYEVHIDNAYPAFDWLNSHHFDYRGLIPMGLALEAPEGIYSTQY